MNLKNRNDRSYTIQNEIHLLIIELVEICFGTKTSYAISNTLSNAALQMNNKPYNFKQDRLYIN